MRLPFLIIAFSLGLGTAGWAQPGAAQANRDFVLTDDEGHLVVRFAGSDAEPSPAQLEGMSNVFLSVMVQDRLWADIAFETEPLDSHWAGRMEPTIEAYLRGTRLEGFAADVECRSASCRLVLEHEPVGGVSKHAALMDVVEDDIHGLIESNPGSFEPGFLITAYDQISEQPHIKVFLQRTKDRDVASQPHGG